MAMKKKELTASALKEALWTTLLDVRAKSISPTVANSVAAQAREMMRVVRTELEFLRAQGKKPVTKLLG